MNIAVFSFYPFRPHKFTHKYFEILIRECGYKYYDFNCFAGVDKCLYKGINDNDSILTCLKCNSYSLTNVKKGLRNYALSDDIAGLSQEINFLDSALMTAHRLETIEQLYDMFPENSQERLTYQNSIELTYANFKAFCVRNAIQFVIGFNGRMDHTKACFQVCKDVGIPFISYESSWYGHGLHIGFNADCLDLSSTRIANNRFASSPLGPSKMLLAFDFLSKRWNKDMRVEWRDFSNLSSLKNTKPLPVLILPSSRSEFEGHIDYISEWGHSTNGFSNIIEVLKIPKKDVFIQLHPIWFQKIYGKTGHRILEFYKNWALEKGYNLISELEAFDSKSLIMRADLVLVNGSSAIFEAGILGKKIINVENNRFDSSGIVINCRNKNELECLIQNLENFNDKMVKRSTFRFMYTVAIRMPLFQSDIRNLPVPTNKRFFFTSTFEFQNVISAAIDNDVLFSDDSTDVDNTVDEAIFADMLTAGEDLIEFGTLLNLESLVDKFRKKMKKGDL